MRHPSFGGSEESETGGKESSQAADQKCQQHSAVGVSGSSIHALVPKRTNVKADSNFRFNKELPQHQNCFALNNRRRREYCVVLVTLLVIVGIYLLCFAPRLATRTMFELLNFGLNIDLKIVSVVSRVGDFGQPFYAFASFIVHFVANRRCRRLLRATLAPILCIRKRAKQQHLNTPSQRVIPQILEPWRFAKQESSDGAIRNPYEDFENVRRIAMPHALITLRRGGRSGEGRFHRIFRLLIVRVCNFWRRCVCCCPKKRDPFANHWANEPFVENSRPMRPMREPHLFCNNSAADQTHLQLRHFTAQDVCGHQMHIRTYLMPAGQEMRYGTRFRQQRPSLICLSQNNAAYYCHLPNVKLGISHRGLDLQHRRSGLDGSGADDVDTGQSPYEDRFGAAEYWPACECWGTYRCVRCRIRDKEIAPWEQKKPLNTLPPPTRSFATPPTQSPATTPAVATSTSNSGLGECPQEFELVTLKKEHSRSSSSICSGASAPDSTCKRVVSECIEESKVFVWQSRAHKIYQVQYENTAATRPCDSAAVSSLSCCKATSCQTPHRSKPNATNGEIGAQGLQSNSGSQSLTLTHGSAGASNTINVSIANTVNNAIANTSTNQRRRVQRNWSEASILKLHKASKRLQICSTEKKSEATIGSDLSEPKPMGLLLSAQTVTCSQTDSENICIKTNID